MARLFIFTDAYPFGHGESFIAAELPYLLACGLRPHLVPTQRLAQDDIKAMRPVPSGVVVRTDIAQRLAQARGKARLSQLGAGLRALRHWPFGAAALARELALLWRLSPVASWHNGVRLAHAVAHASMLAEALHACADGPAPGDGLYAYWLGASAAGAHWAYPRLPVVARAHGHDLFAQRHIGAYLPLQEPLVAALAGLYCISEDGARHARARFAAVPHKICVMPLGVAASQARAKASQDGVVRLISCARISAIKDVGRLVAALRHVKRPMHWTHIGDGPDKERLMRACAQLPEHIRTCFVGAVPPDQVEAHLTGGPADLFVNTSQHEGRPVSIMEALRAGLPVRAPNVGGIGEMLPEAWLFAAQATPEAIASCLDAFAALPRRHRQAQGQVALRLWRRRAAAQLYYPAFAEGIGRQLRCAT